MNSFIQILDAIATRLQRYIDPGSILVLIILTTLGYQFMVLPNRYSVRPRLESQAQQSAATLVSLTLVAIPKPDIPENLAVYETEIASLRTELESSDLQTSKAQALMTVAAQLGAYPNTKMLWNQTNRALSTPTPQPTPTRIAVVKIAETPTSVSVIETATPTPVSVPFFDGFDIRFAAPWRYIGSPPIVSNGKLTSILQDSYVLLNTPQTDYRFGLALDPWRLSEPCDGNVNFIVGKQSRFEITIDSEQNRVFVRQYSDVDGVWVEIESKFVTSQSLQLSCDPLSVLAQEDRIILVFGEEVILETNALSHSFSPIAFNFERLHISSASLRNLD